MMMRKVLEGKLYAGNPRRSIAIVVASVAVFSAFGEEAFYKLSSASGNWADPASWTNSSGVVLSVAPTNAEDTVNFDSGPSAGTIRTVTIFKDDSPTAFSVGKVTGGKNNTLVFPIRDDALSAKPQLLTVWDVDDFRGKWRTLESRSGLVLQTASGSTAHMSQVSGENRFVVDVRNAGARAEIGQMYAGGVIVKRGEGTLVVKDVVDPNTSKVYVESGTLELLGRDLEPTYPKDGIIVHLDADRLDTLTYAHDAVDGRDYVSKWADADGGTYCFTESNYTSDNASYISRAHKPFISPYVSATNKRFVDFGSHYGDTDADKLLYGPTNCVMVASPTVTGVREAFYVARFTPSGASDVPAVLGWDFWRSGNKISYTGANADLVNQYLKAGEFRINGTEVPYNITFKAGYHTDRFSSGLTDVHVLNCTPEGGSVSVNKLGATDYWLTRVGGMRVGEVLLYNRRLTDEERMSVNRYLMKKWLPDVGTQDLEAVVVEGGSAAVSVPAGRTARVTSVSVPAGKLVKKGDGILEIGSINPKDAQMEIQGGSIRFASGQPEVSTSAPAANPYLRLDATREDTMTTRFDTDGVTKLVDEWRDADGGTWKAVLPTSGESGYTGLSPILRPAAQNGLPVVNFRDRANLAGSWLKLSSDKYCTYDAFVVMRYRYATESTPVFGSSDRNLLGDATKFLNPSYAANGPAAALWTVEGGAEDPFVNYSGWHGTSFHVISFSSASTAKISQLANDRSGNYAGGLEIAEMILYDRRLTADERRQTQAYLMKKWLDADHPESVAGATMAGMEFGDGGSSLSKTGDSDCEIDPLYLEDASRVSVNGGSMTVVDETEAGAVFHLDAQNAASISDKYKIGSKTYVRKWDDARGNGKSATNVTGKVASGNVVTNPTLVSVTMPDGVARPALSFGIPYRADQAALIFTAAFSVGEVHAVIADNTPTANWGWLFGGTSSVYGGGQTLLFREESYTATVRGGYIAIDGVVTNNTGLSAGRGKRLGTSDGKEMHLLSIAPYDNGHGTISISGVGSGQNIGSPYGGVVLCEQIMFSRGLTANCRSRLQKRMMAKWFGASTSYALCSLDSISLSGDSRLDFGEGNCVVSTAVGGAGTLSAKAVLGVEEIVYTIGDSPLSVTGELAFKSGVPIVVRVSKPAEGRARSGIYPVLVGSGVPVFEDLSNFRLEASEGSSAILDRCQLLLDGNGRLLVHYSEPGVLFIVY